MHIWHNFIIWSLAGLLALVTSATVANAQPEADTDPEMGLSQAELQQIAQQAAENRNPQVDPTRQNATNQSSINFLTLLMQGGVFMIPIAVMSILVVSITLERLLALRRSRTFPRGLRREIRKATDTPDEFSPRLLYEVSRRFPSASARILQDLLLKTGRPIPEVESAISDGTQREADRLYGNVRWLTLAAAVTPLIGLLGTVWGMIIAFYNTTQMGAGTNKAESLAGGIYVALVTTLGGLAVAIPAAIFAHFFEGRITRIMSKIEFELRRLVPRLEPLEGKARFDLGVEGFQRRRDDDAGRPAEQLLPDAPVTETRARGKAS